MVSCDVVKSPLSSASRHENGKSHPPLSFHVEEEPDDFKSIVHSDGLPLKIASAFNVFRSYLILFSIGNISVQTLQIYR